MSKRQQQIISSIAIGSTVAALSVTNVEAASAPKVGEKPATKNNLIAQTPASQQPLVPNPKVTIDGMQATPGVGLVTPTMPRAVAPPVGDISTANMNGSAPQVLIESKKLYSITATQSAREILRQIAFEANLNIVDTDNLASDGKPTSTPDKIITVRFRNEPIQNVFNSVLQLSGLEASRSGKIIFVSSKLPEAAKETSIRTLRLNQITALAASNFLAVNGAESLVTIIKDGKPELYPLKAPDGLGVLVLRGLTISSDERLNSITLVGSPNKVEMASSMLARLDARRRQVALNVKIVDVNLNNNTSISNSLSFGSGDSFFSADKGAAVYNYGGYNPPSNRSVLGSTTTPPIGAVNLPGGATPFLDYSPNANQSGQTSGDSAGLGNVPRPNFGSNTNPYQPGVTSYTPPTITPGAVNNGATTVTDPITGAPVPPGGQFSPTIIPAKYTYAVPTNFQYPTKFLSTLQAQIVSGNGKILTDPTMVVQEGQKSTVNLTQEVFAGFKLNSVAGNGATTSVREPIIKQAGLILDVLVNRIDDNGYISVAVNPTVSSIGGTFNTLDGDIALIQSRSLNSGEIRLRDGQTLILSGIIQEQDRTAVTKVPILGDIPLLGALFRSTTKANQRQEVVVLLTPQIINDNRPQVNYTPGNDARQMINR